MILVAFLAATILGKVIQANQKSFDKIVLRTDQVVMVEFFAPWCGHCKALQPEYEVAAKKLDGLAKLVAVDCDDKSNAQVCSKYGVQGFPTLKLFSAGTKGMPQDYNGARTAKDIISAIKPMITAIKVTKVGQKAKKSKDLKEFIENDNSLTRVLLLTDKKNVPLLYKALSLTFSRHGFIFGEAKSSNEEIVKALGVDSFPSLLAFLPGSNDPVKYNGEINRASIAAWLKPYATTSSKKSKTPKKTQVPREHTEL